MAIGLAVVLGLVALTFVLSPLLRRSQTNEQDLNNLMVMASNEDDGVSSPEESEQAARVALQDVELDYQLGNLEEPDYLALRELHMRRALVAFKSRSEHEQKIDEEIEEQVRRMKGDDSPWINPGASRSSPTENTRRGSFAKAPPEPTVRFNLGRWLVGSKILRQRLAHTKRLIR